MTTPLALGLLALGFLVAFLAYRGYRLYSQHLAQHALRLKEVADLNFATIEALALAIDAKDQTSQQHIKRLELFATALARQLGMSEGHIQGVRTAALLHDIGKLAVPEHILSKPGPLTSEEFQKIRAHPKIGAEIIGSVPFPYPVAPLILSHHERWDGKGYPEGLKGEEIPLGARILTVVDYFDAVMAERPYHKPLAMDATIGLLKQEAGKALDPNVVRAFLQLLPALLVEAARLGLEGDVSPALPATAKTAGTGDAPVKNVFDDIALAHREIFALYEIAQSMGTSLGLADTMTLISSKLSNLVPFSCAALFLLDEATDQLECRFATGVDADVIRQVSLRSGSGLAGWVARNRRPVVNARPSTDLEAAGLDDLTTTLQSALACPLLVGERFIGVLATYHEDAGFYRDDHRRLLERISEQASSVIRNSLTYEQIREDSLTDSLTSLPNARNLFTHLSRELARAQRLDTEIALLVMDLDRFKEINDTHGHHVGDRALRDVARVLRETIRPYDMCVRYAGDEFVVVLSGCGAAEADQKRQELQQAVEAIVFEVRPGRQIPLGISVGAAVFPHDAHSYEALLAAADSRMYKDKTARQRRGAPEQPHQPPLPHLPDPNEGIPNAIMRS